MGKAARIKPVARTENSSESDNFQDFTFNLKYGRSASSTNVTFPSASIAQIAKTSKTQSPLLQATIVDARLSPDSTQHTSQVVTISTLDSSVKNIDISIQFADMKFPNASSATNDSFKRQLNKAEITYWNLNKSQWSPAGNCHQKNREEASYNCNTLSSYCVLFTSITVPSIVALQGLSFAGCILSIICLVATIAIYLFYKKLRTKPTTLNLVSICLNLVALYFFFIIGVDRAENKQACDAMTFLLHYFTLTSLSWMCVNAFQMYKAFTQYSYSSSVSTAMTCGLAYGIPFVWVFLNFSITIWHLDNYYKPEDIFFESLYRYKYVCWLHAKSLYWGFLLPLGGLLLINYVIFGLLVKKVFFRKQIKSTAKREEFVDRLIKAVTMVTMMGLTWIFGYFLLLADDVTYQSIMQWLFTLTNVFQGALVFYLYCLRHEKVRLIWLPCSARFAVKTTSSSDRQTSSSRVTMKPLSHKQSSVVSET